MKVLERLKKWIAGFAVLVLALSWVPMPVAAATVTVGDNSATDFGFNWYGSATWTSLQNAAASDNLYTTAFANNSMQTTAYFKASGFGFNVPADATIKGVTVSLERSQTGSGTSFYDEVAMLIQNNTVTYAPAYNRSTGATWGNTDSTVTYGAESDVWGQSLTPSIVNSPGFGFAVAARKISGSKTARIDWVGMKVYYTQNTAPSVPALTSPLNLSATNDATPLLEWNQAVDSDNDSVGYTAKLLGSGLPENGLQYTTVNTSVEVGPLNDGDYTWQVMSWDNKGNLSAWSPIWNFRVDTEAPDFSNIKAPKGYVNSNDHPNFTWTEVTDSNGPVKYQAQWSSEINTESNDLVNPTVSELQTNPELPIPADLEEGVQYWWQVRNQDSLGNTLGWSEPVEFVIDNTAPIAEKIEDIRTNKAVVVNVEANDSVNGKDLTFEWAELEGITFSEKNSVNPEISADVDGTYKLTVTVSDKAGNSVLVSFNFTWDTTVNTVENFKAISAGDGKVNLSWTDPEDEGLEGVDVYRGTVEGELGEKLARVKAGEEKYDDTTVLPGQTYYYTAVALDDLGNASEDNAQLKVVLPVLVTAVTSAPVTEPVETTVNTSRAQAVTEAPAQKEEVKGGNTNEAKGDEKKEEDNSRTLSAFGIGLLAVLALVGLYLLYLQNPDWFAWLYFWKKKKKNGKK